MLERFLTFLKSVPVAQYAGPDAEENVRVAAAALMIHLMDADGDRHAAEMRQLRQALAGTFGVAAERLKATIREAEEADRNAIDLYAFTSVLNRHLDAEGRIEFIGIMWEIVYADGVLHEVEDNIVWRVAELIGVDSKDRVALRRRVANRLAVPEGPSPDD